ncbi:cupin domain-containing protein [Mycolicibacterium sarraceniae]|uniref:Cupin n=1 Tax=Mycolicibacterium sarraceniae TaxID=1534348 RepID=A0A7I7SQ18_9MYCO|nr:hypothetical protein [Mycolicibacterium sarraceniae]BBY59087.1 hypothetical protein MSAR_22230 [Mycolicibacterium sarraceniae]
MSLHVPRYPPPRYDGTGAVSATLRTANTPADFESWGVTYTYLATERSTGGEFGLCRVDLGPQAGRQGDYLCVPPGGLHGFGNVSDEERRESFDRTDNFFPEPPDNKDAYP